MHQLSNHFLSDEQQQLNPKLMDRFIKISDAARILGYASFQSINQMIQKQAIHAYTLPETSRSRVLLSDILALKQKQNSELDNPTKKMRGRPRKISY